MAVSVGDEYNGILTHFFKCLVTVVVTAEMSTLICLWFLNFILQLPKKYKCRELESCDHRNTELSWVLFSKLF